MFNEHLIFNIINILNNLYKQKEFNKNSYSQQSLYYMHFLNSDIASVSSLQHTDRYKVIQV